MLLVVPIPLLVRYCVFVRCLGTSQESFHSQICRGIFEVFELILDADPPHNQVPTTPTSSAACTSFNQISRSTVFDPEYAAVPTMVGS